MSRYSVAAKAGAYLAGTNGQPPTSRVGSTSANARPVAGVTAYDDWVPPSLSDSCSATTRKGEPCKGKPLGESGLCMSHKE